MKKYYYKFILFETNKIFWVSLNEDGTIRYGDSIDYDLSTVSVIDQMDPIEVLNSVYYNPSLDIISIYSLKHYLCNV